MNRIRLILIDKKLSDLLEEPDAFQNAYHISAAASIDFVKPVVQQTLALLERRPRDLPWGCFLAADDRAGCIVGTCGFTDGPSSGGEIEIAYYTFPQFERNGYATEMARQLLEIALQAPDALKVIAHTMPEENASTAVLKKIRMQFAGEIMHPEDGRIWKWEYARERRL